jgi:hypothetical protein
VFNFVFEDHFLALKILEYLHLNPNSVLIHWAKTKMSSADHNLSDERLADMILQKLESYKGISYAELVESALQSERRKLANIV